jgi:hypothetical protein
MTGYDVSLGGSASEDGVISGGGTAGHGIVARASDDGAGGEVLSTPSASVPTGVGDGALTEMAMPLWARLHLTHAVMQAVADEAGVDLLHIKGPSVAAELRTAPRRSTDVDVLVRPAHLQRFLAALRRYGWSEMSSFADGSPFGHAANYGHADWAYVDVHRHFPGPLVPPDEVFETLWRERTFADIAHRRCALPSLPAQVLILALHEARSHHARGTFEAWELSDEARRGAVWALARRLGAEVPMAAAVGQLAEFADRREYLWWRYWSQPESGKPGADRLAEWTARLHAARTVRERLAVLGGMFRVNRTHLRLELGHEPSAGEVAAEYRHRAVAGLRAIVARGRAHVPGKWR